MKLKVSKINNSEIVQIKKFGKKHGKNLFDFFRITLQIQMLSIDFKMFLECRI